VTPLRFLLVVFSESCSVFAQIFFKHAMSGDPRAKAAKLAAGITAKTLEFFIWEGLLSKIDLSFLYPFEGLNRLLLIVAASIFLKEKMTLSLWVGVLLICSGIMLVSAS
jgi:uncharacterized membrane protein